MMRICAIMMFAWLLVVSAFGRTAADMQAELVATVGDLGRVTQDADGSWRITVTNVDSRGWSEVSLMDDIGSVIFDLNGYEVKGRVTVGRSGDAGNPTHVKFISPDAAAKLTAGVEVSTNVQEGVLVSVGGNVTLTGAVAIRGNVYENYGTIEGLSGEDAVPASWEWYPCIGYVGHDVLPATVGGTGVVGGVNFNYGRIEGGCGGAGCDGCDEAAGGCGVVGEIEINVGCIVGGGAPVTVDGGYGVDGGVKENRGEITCVYGSPSVRGDVGKNTGYIAYCVIGSIWWNVGSYDAVVGDIANPIGDMSTSYTYNGSSRTIESVPISAYFDSFASYSTSLSGPYASTPPTWKNAGTYTVWYTHQTDMYPEFVVTNSATVTIGSRSVTLRSASATRAYTGEPLTASGVSVSTGSFVSGDGYTTQTCGSQTDVGSSKNDFTYDFNAGTLAGNYSISKTLGTLTVTARTILSENVEIMNVPVTYTGLALEPEVQVTVPEVTVGTQVKGRDYTVTYANNVNAGTATVTVKGIGNYAGTVTKTFTIDRAVVPPPSTLSGTYSGSSLTSGLADTALYRVVQDFGGVTVGTYPVVLELVDSANYRWDGTESIQKAFPFTVTKADNAWTDGPSVEDWMFGETPSTPVAQSKFGAVRILYDGGLSPKYLDYGWHTVSFTVEGNDNYSGLYEEVDFEIYEPMTKPVTVICSWDCQAGAEEPSSWACSVLSNLVPCVELELTAADGWHASSNVPIYDEDDWIDYALCPEPVAGVTSVVTSYGAKSMGFVGSNDKVLTEDGWKRKKGVSKTTVVRTEHGWERLGDVEDDTLVVSDDRSYGEIFFIVNTLRRSIAAAVVDYVGMYDGQGHGCTLEVSNPTDGWTALYALSPDGPFVANPLLVTNVCENLTVWCEITAPGFVTVTNVASVTLVPRPLTEEMVVLSDDVWFFDGENKQPSVVVADGSPNIATTNDYVIVYGTRTGAGLVPVTVTGRGNYTGSVTKEFAILKRPVAPPIITPMSYNGKKRMPTIPADDRWTIVKNPGGVNVGFYTNVVLRLTNTDDYQWKGMDEDVSDWVGVFEIRRASNGWSTTPGIESWTYGETPSELKGKPRYGTLSVAYRVRGAAVETETSERPSAIGLYTARFWVEATQNYAGVASREVDFEIIDPNAGDATTTTPVPVPHSWIDKYVAEFGGGNRETAGNATGRNGRPLWESYVAGLDPTDENSQFMATITVGAGGVPTVTWSPDLSDGNPPRTYTTVGKGKLTDETWTPVTDANKADMKFFRVQVEIGE